MTEFVVEKKGGKLSAVLTSRFPRMTYGTLRKLFRKGDVRINGQKVFCDGYVNVGDKIRVYYDETASQPKLIFEDRHIAVFFKPHKIPTVGENSFEDFVRSFYPAYVCCHRLDTNTEGLVIFAKDVESEQAVKAALKSHSIEKKYLAFVHGVVTEEKEAVAYLKKDERLGVVKITDERTPGAVKIVTHYKPIENYEFDTALEVTLVTGKTHQIRAHLAHEGYPIIGDPKYGENDVNRLYNKSFQMLTAYKLVFHVKSGILSDINGKVISLDVSKLLSSFSSIVKE